MQDAAMVQAVQQGSRVMSWFSSAAFTSAGTEPAGCGLSADIGATSLPRRYVPVLLCYAGGERERGMLS